MHSCVQGFYLYEIFYLQGQNVEHTNICIYGHNLHLKHRQSLEAHPATPSTDRVQASKGL